MGVEQSYRHKIWWHAPLVFLFHFWVMAFGAILVSIAIFLRFLMSLFDIGVLRSYLVQSEHDG